MTSRAFRVVEMFEEAMAEYAGSRYGVAVDSGTTAIFLSLLRDDCRVKEVTIPARTYISVPFAIIRAGGIPKFLDVTWSGQYQLNPSRVIDSALRMNRGMFEGGFHCLSFHMRKHLPIGRGGMILTNNEHDADWFRKARFDGRYGSVPFTLDNVDMMGYNAYMLPEQAARGLQLLEAKPAVNPDLRPDYPDLREMEVFKPFV